MLHVDERSSFKLQCQTRAGDFQYISWKKRNAGRNLVSELKRNQFNLTNTLSIEHAQLDDAGDYLCVGWTTNDTKISLITVVVKGMLGVLLYSCVFVWKTLKTAIWFILCQSASVSKSIKSHFLWEISVRRRDLWLVNENPKLFEYTTSSWWRKTTPNELFVGPML